jgi:Ser/Thr protein kinase RdoA (MazF antagonist)
MTDAAASVAPSIPFDEFRDLPDEEQVAGLRSLASGALAAWDFDAPALEPIKYRENAVFAVRDRAGQRAILRVHRPDYRSDLDIRCELAWMRHLGGQGVATPVAIAASDGRLVVTAGDSRVPQPRQCDVLAWVEGSSPGTLEGGVIASDDEVRTLYRSVGEVAARMHEIVLAWDRPEPFSRPSWNVETLVGDSPTFGRFWELEAASKEQLDVLLAARDIARERLAPLAPATFLIHGDLVPDNILVDGDVHRIIDFDDFGWSWVGFEMATSLFPLQLSGGFDAGLEGYLEGYRGVRAFPGDELEALPDMLMARSLSYLGWPVGRPEIASARDLAPMFVAMLSESAAGYVASRR